LSYPNIIDGFPQKIGHVAGQQMINWEAAVEDVAASADV